MKQLLSAILVLLIGSSLFAAIPAGTVWEIRTGGSQANGGGFAWTSLVNATYKWTASAEGTNEYYCEIAAGGDPSLTASGSVTLDGNYNIATEGTAGSLTSGQYDWADNDTLGYTTLYVCLANGLDPDVMIARGQPGYVSYGAGGIDYSQQDPNQLTLADFATDGAGTGLSTATGGLTAAMKNNIIYLTGGTATAGWYHIVSVASTNACTIDRSAGASKTDVTGNVGGAFAFGGTLDNEFNQSQVGGNRQYIKAGTYTAGETINGDTADSNYKNYILGYNATRGDNPLDDSRPLINVGASYFYYSSDYTVHAHLRFTGSSASGVVRAYPATGQGVIFNCSSQNTGSGPGFSVATYPTILIACEATSASGTAFALGNYGQAVACYAHDSTTGFTSGLHTNLVNCVADTCTTGITLASPAYAYNCTVYNCTTGITYNSAGAVVFNCVIDSCTTGATDGSVNPRVVWLYNCLNNTTNFSGGYAAFGNIFADPGLNDPANGDFSITSADTNVYEQGVDVGTFTSATTYEE